MACPETITLRDLSGKFRLNRQLSDSSDSLLAMQGIGWALRKLMGVVPIVVNIKPCRTEGDNDILEAETIVGGGIHRSAEQRKLDWQPVERTDANFGRLRVRNGWTASSEIKDDFLRAGQEAAQADMGMILIKVESLDNGWVQDQTWGLEELDGERRYVRRIVVTKGHKRETARLIFDWEGAA